MKNGSGRHVKMTIHKERKRRNREEGWAVPRLQQQEGPVFASPDGKIEMKVIKVKMDQTERRTPWTVTGNI